MIKSYYTMRQAIGYMGISLALALFIGSCTGGYVSLGVSISSYAWSNAHVILEGVLAICGSFLIFYTGYGGCIC